MTALLSLAGITATHVRLVTPWIGAWFAEVELDLETMTAPLPSGRVVLTIGDEALVGRVDARATSRLGAKASVRVLAGGGGWDLPVRSQHFHNDAGVTLLAVAQATAAEVGEVVGSAPRVRLGVDYVRSAGPASRILHADPWYVNDIGVTRIEARAEESAPKDLEILGWDPASSVAELAPDVIVRPGWVLTDDRFGSQVVRDVEQTWSAAGTRASAFCATTARSRLAGTLAHAVREFAGVAHLKSYRYRVVLMAGERVALQAVKKDAGMPDAIPLSLVYGVPGVTAVLTPGQEVLVEFVAGDPAQPVVRSYVDGTPVSVKLDAVTLITLGLGTEPVALGASTLAAINALATAITIVGDALAAVTGTPASPVAPLTGAHATAAAPATAAVAAMNAALVPLQALIPAKKVVAG